MRSIKKSAVLAVAFTGLFAGAARAQERVVATVPFPFVVHGHEPHALAEALGERGVAIRAGKFCAHPLVRHLRGGLAIGFHIAH